MKRLITKTFKYRLHRFNCKMIKKDLELKDRTFVCACGYEEDRDVNSAKNILYKAQTTEQELSSIDEEHD